jgi:hypothetical protein
MQRSLDTIGAFERRKRLRYQVASYHNCEFLYCGKKERTFYKLRYISKRLDGHKIIKNTVKLA